MSVAITVEELAQYRDAVEAITAESGRPDVRAVVELAHLINLRAVERGGNVHQTSLDLNDVWMARLEGMPDDAVVRLLNLQSEEVNALAAKVEADTAVKQAELDRVRGEQAYQRALNDARSTQGGALVAFVVVFVLLYWALR